MFLSVRNTGSIVLLLKFIIITHNVVALKEKILLLLSSYCFYFMHVNNIKTSMFKDLVADLTQIVNVVEW
jgi:hypothetical protein